MARVYKDDRIGRKFGVHPWCIEYTGLDNRRHRERCSALTKDEAQAFLHLKVSEINKARLSGASSTIAMKPILFERFVDDEYLPHCRATHTASTFDNDEDLATVTKAFFGKMMVRMISPGDIQRFVDRAAPFRSNSKKMTIRPATVNRRLMFVSGVLAEAVRRGYIDRNPAAGIAQLPEDNRKLRWLSEAEEDRLVAHLPGYLRPIVLTALHTGMRLGEVLQLKWVDVDFVQGLVQVTLTKNHKTRYVPINDTLGEILGSIPQFVGPDGPCPNVFVNPETGSGYRNIAHSFKQACRRAGIPEVTFHTLRHTFASRLAQAGVPLNDIRELLGHGDMTMTLRYAHLAKSNLRNAVAILARPRGDPAQDGTRMAQIGDLKTGKM